jgi:hypothetical protein
VELLEIMLRYRCCPTIFHIITSGGADRWFQNWPVWSTPHSSLLPTLFYPFATCPTSTYILPSLLYNLKSAYM